MSHLAKFKEYWATSRGKFFTIAIVILVLLVAGANGTMGLIAVPLVLASLFILTLLKSLVSKYRLNFMLGAFWFLGGLILTVVTYLNANDEGAYIFFWGAMAYGLYQMFSSTDDSGGTES